MTPHFFNRSDEKTKDIGRFSEEKGTQMYTILKLMNHLIDGCRTSNALFYGIIHVFFVPLRMKWCQAKEHSWLEWTGLNRFMFRHQEDGEIAWSVFTARRNWSLTNAVTKPISISTIQPASDRDLIRNCFDWLTDIFLKKASYLSEGLIGVTSPFLEEALRKRRLVELYRSPNFSSLSYQMKTVRHCLASSP